MVGHDAGGGGRRRGDSVSDRLRNPPGEPRQRRCPGHERLELGAMPSSPETGRPSGSPATPRTSVAVTPTARPTCSSATWGAGPRRGSPSPAAGARRTARPQARRSRPTAPTPCSTAMPTTWSWATRTPPQTCSSTTGRPARPPWCPPPRWWSGERPVDQGRGVGRRHPRRLPELRGRPGARHDGRRLADLRAPRLRGVTTRASTRRRRLRGRRQLGEPDDLADGRHVAFESKAANLVAGDINGASDVFVKDLATGAIERVSVGSDGAEAAGGSIRPSLSADGR